MAEKPKFDIQRLHDILKVQHRCLHDFGTQREEIVGPDGRTRYVKGVCRGCAAQFPAGRLEVQDLTPYALAVIAQALMPLFEVYAEYAAQKAAELVLDGVVGKLMDGKTATGDSEPDNGPSVPVTRGGNLRP